MRLFPPQHALLDAALSASLAKIPDGPGKSDGLKLGKKVAEDLFALRSGDGWNMQIPYSFASELGSYQATPPMNAAPILPQWRHVKPFMIESAAQFKISGPPAPDSAAFARDFAEVRSLGSRTSKERSNEQTATAIHWAGSEVPPLNAVARAAATSRKLGLLEEARFFAHLNMAMADALIVGFEAKYTFNSWRPITAIRNAPAGIPALAAEPAWEPLLVTPPHQEYPSAHCLGAGAAVTVIREVLGGDKVDLDYVYPPLGVARHWSSLEQLVKEVEDARVWAGIHFRSAVEHGTAIGQEVAAYGLKNSLRPL